MYRNSQNIYVLTYVCIILSCMYLMHGCSIANTAPLLGPDSWPAVDSAFQVPNTHTPERIALRYAIKNANSTFQEEFEFVSLPQPFQMTAYAAPVIEARKQYGGDFIYAIRGLPSWVSDEDTLPARSDIEAHYGTTGVIGWVQNGLDAYLAEVNGSVKLQFDDATTACLGWVRTNELPYTSLGKMLAHDGFINPNAIDLEAIRDVYRQEPELVHGYMLRNDRAVFFEHIACEEWPRASTGIKLLPRSCAAVDPELIPLGSILLLEGVFSDGVEFKIPVAAVDIGGAIKGPRIDLYMGDGDAAMKFAGEQNQNVDVSILRKKSAGKYINR